MNVSVAHAQPHLDTAVAQGNLIYLGLITDRVPIIGRFIPTHVPDAPPIPFAEVFDVPRLRRSLGVPILTWDEVKREDSEVLDELGCWNVWQAVQYREEFPRGSPLPEMLKLGIRYSLACFTIINFELSTRHFLYDCSHVGQDLP